MVLTFTELGYWGRLGNQLFQIAATMGIARQLGMQPVFPQWPYADFCAGPVPLAAALPGNLPRHLEASFLYQRPGISGPADLVGFFQSERYFADIRAEVRRTLGPCESIKQQCLAQLQSLLDGDTCSMHVRRGDYVGHRGFTDLAATDYYERAMACFPPRTKFLLFSDDLPFCRQRFRDTRITFIEGRNEVVDLSLMTLCKSHIIANSSFSWWGAWLNPDLSKKVIAPQHWFGGRFADPGMPFIPGPPHDGFHDTRDLIPDGWLRV